MSACSKNMPADLFSRHALLHNTQSQTRVSNNTLPSGSRLVGCEVRPCPPPPLRLYRILLHADALLQLQQANSGVGQHRHTDVQCRLALTRAAAVQYSAHSSGSPAQNAHKTTQLTQQLCFVKPGGGATLSAPCASRSEGPRATGVPGHHQTRARGAQRLRAASAAAPEQRRLKGAKHGKRKFTKYSASIAEGHE